jgi:hypothetical protein
LADPQNPHGAPVRLARARSRDDPALCSHQDRLILAVCHFTPQECTFHSGKYLKGMAR